jgi:cytosine/adenosine deaminase-related metal-dependent hydrolase
LKRTLIAGGTVLTLDSRLGDLPRGDVLIEGERIAAVAPAIDAGDAERVDASGRIVIPGLVNAHMHTWQTSLRGVAANWTILGYFKNMHAGLATRFRPEDIRISTLVGALNQINCGTTTLVDWCHNNPTPAHTDAAVEGLLESGIRAAFFHGSPKPDPKAGERPFWEMPHPRSEVERLLRGPFSGRHGLLSLGVAILGPHYSTYDVALQDFRLAREFGLIASMHCAGAEARTPDGWDRLRHDDLLGDNNNIVHGQSLTDDQLKFMVDHGVSFSLEPETEMHQGHGFAITGRVRRHGGRLSLGVDLEAGISGDMFTVARMALATQRAIDNDDLRRDGGTLPERSSIECREALEWMTVEGARMLKQDARIGSLTPGKQADLVVIRADDLNMSPVHDPVASVVQHTSIANIEHVLIGGEFRKRDGKLLYPHLAARKKEVLESGQRILREQRLATAASGRS